MDGNGSHIRGVPCRSMNVCFSGGDLCTLRREDDASHKRRGLWRKSSAMIMVMRDLFTLGNTIIRSGDKDPLSGLLLA